MTGFQGTVTKAGRVARLVLMASALFVVAASNGHAACTAATTHTLSPTACGVVISTAGCYNMTTSLVATINFLILYILMARHLGRLETRFLIATLTRLAICGAVLLVVSFVDQGLATTVAIPALIFCVFAGLWFVLPLARRGERDGGR